MAEPAMREQIMSVIENTEGLTYRERADAVLAVLEKPTEAMIKAWEPLKPQWSKWEAPPRLEYPLLSGPEYAWEVGIRAAREGN